MNNLDDYIKVIVAMYFDGYSVIESVETAKEVLNIEAV